MNYENELIIINGLDELIETLKEMRKSFEAIDKRLKAIGNALEYMNN